MKRFLILLSIVLALLSIPWIAMQFSSEINWQLPDFIIMGSALFTLGLIYEWIIRRSNKYHFKIGMIVALVALFLLFWVNGAVGLIGNESQTINTLYYGVILLVLGGSIWVRYQSSNMSRLMYLAAVIQFAIPLVGLMIWPPPQTSWSPGVPQVFMLNGFFVLMFILSGHLFNRAGKTAHG